MFCSTKLRIHNLNAETIIIGKNRLPRKYACGYASVRPVSYLRPFLYFDPPTLLNFTSTFLAQVYFDLFGKTLLRPKLYFGFKFFLSLPFSVKILLSSRFCVLYRTIYVSIIKSFLLLWCNTGTAM